MGSKSDCFIGPGNTIGAIYIYIYSMATTGLSSHLLTSLCPPCFKKEMFLLNIKVNVFTLYNRV